MIHDAYMVHIVQIRSPHTWIPTYAYNMCMYVCMYVCMYECIYENMCIYIHIHTYIHTYMHAYIHTYIHTYMAPDVVRRLRSQTPPPMVWSGRGGGGCWTLAGYLTLLRCLHKQARAKQTASNSP